MKKTGYLWVLIIAGIAGAVFSFYALLAHYGQASTEFCTVNETFDCDVVNGSSYSEFLGAPVAGMGLFAYLVIVMFGGVLFWYEAKGLRTASAKQLKEWIREGLKILTVIGFVFSLYLTGIEAFVLMTWCMLCLGSQASILIALWAIFSYQKIITKEV